MNFRISDAGLEQDREAIVSLLRNFNQQKREPSEKVPLGIYYEDENGKNWQVWWEKRSETGSALSCCLFVKN